jgi:zinc transporter
MTFRYEANGVRWIDLENPTADEVRAAARECDLGGRITEELRVPSPIPKVLSENAATLLVIHLPASVSGKPARSSKQEIDLVVGHDYVLTARYEVIAPLHELRKTLEVTGLVSHNGKLDAGALLEILCNRLFEAVRGAVISSGKRLERIENEMFNERGRVTIRTISEIGQELLHLEAALAGDEGALTLFLDEIMVKDTLGASFKDRARRILNEEAQTARMIATFRGITAELRETNAALINTAQNDIIRRLTVITFLVLPLGLIAGIFELSVPGIPFSHNPHGFWIVVGIMITVSTLAGAFVVSKKWL